jgi:hypothetical protein
MSRTDERRRNWRFPATLDIRLGQGSGVSHNVSASGLYLETDAPLVTGQPITFSLMLNELYPDVPLDLQCTGIIRRIEPRGRRWGVAVTIDSWSFKRSTHVGAVQQGQRPGDEELCHDSSTDR